MVGKYNPKQTLPIVIARRVNKKQGVAYRGGIQDWPVS